MNECMHSCKLKERKRPIIINNKLLNLILEKQGWMWKAGLDVDAEAK